MEAATAELRTRLAAAEADLFEQRARAERAEAQLASVEAQLVRPPAGGALLSPAPGALFAPAGALLPPVRPAELAQERRVRSVPPVRVPCADSSQPALEPAPSSSHGSGSDASSDFDEADFRMVGADEQAGGSDDAGEADEEEDEVLPLYGESGEEDDEDEHSDEDSEGAQRPAGEGAAKRRRRTAPEGPRPLTTAQRQRAEDDAFAAERGASRHAAALAGGGGAVGAAFGVSAPSATARAAVDAFVAEARQEWCETKLPLLRQGASAFWRESREPGKAALWAARAEQHRVQLEKKSVELACSGEEGAELRRLCSTLLPSLQDWLAHSWLLEVAAEASEPADDVARSGGDAEMAEAGGAPAQLTWAPGVLMG